MKVETFWNKAFLAALTRLPAEEAKQEADLATELCIGNWQKQKWRWTHPDVRRWMDQDITDIPAGPRVNVEGDAAAAVEASPVGR